MAYLLTLLEIIVAIIVVRLIKTYREGKALEKCVKHALFCLLARPTTHFENRGYKGEDVAGMTVGVLSGLTSADLRRVANITPEYFQRHSEAIEREAKQILATDAELRELVHQTQMYVAVVRHAHNNRAGADAVFENPLLKPYEKELPPIGPSEYSRLVGRYAEKWLLTEAKEPTTSQ